VKRIEQTLTRTTSAYRSRRVPLTAVAVALVISACGGGDAQTEAPGGGSTAQAPNAGSTTSGIVIDAAQLESCLRDARLDVGQPSTIAGESSFVLIEVRVRQRHVSLAPGSSVRASDTVGFWVFESAQEAEVAANQRREAEAGTLPKELETRLRGNVVVFFQSTPYIGQPYLAPPAETDAVIESCLAGG
jgi:hypothetical protein